MDDNTKIATVRFLAAHKRPYFATALFAMHLVPSTHVATMAVDKYGRVYINPARIGNGSSVTGDQWTPEQCANVLVHELGHWLRKHHERAEHIVRQAPIEQMELTAELCNVAEDCELNDDLIAEGVDLPGDCATPARFGFPDGKLWEEYYQMLLALKPPKRSGGSQSGKAGAGSGPPGGKGSKGAPGKGAKGDGTRPEKCECGSGAHGVPRPYELPAPGGAAKAPGIGEAEGDLLRRQVAAEIQSAAQRQPGTVPAGWKRWAESLLEPAVVPWERELSALVKNAVTMARGAVDYSYTKVSRRGSFGKVLMPALVRPCPEATVVLDTSGSMGGDMLARALCEVQGILRAVGQRKVPVLCCDAAVHGGVQRVSKALDVELAGGGGTDMGVGIAAAQKLQSKVIIVLTDGYTPWPAEPPRGCQLVVGVLDPAEGWEQNYPPPPYAKRVLAIRDPKGKAAAA
jgi:predicted metal-dependent peptidase